ncbi:hypothetical protein [Actinokineospora diospyrosa]|uniref:Secreted protein with PEP-CTERM sorting signal n=1 Tax=Actinokineospora diospyrosa TaxID=103728 RepID=A0ABT1IJW8_9PSEU|nr:hypothetical protein [Actinokineospora diospyrosa]MCP2272948.1 hypothetical protein [Actinokineospora diospyrosa]
MPSEVVVVALIALAGILVGGAYTTWKNSRVAAVVLAVLALLALGGAIAWY